MPAMTLDAVPGIPAEIARMTGPIFISHIFNWGLFGLLCNQVYFYYISFPHDRVVPKAIVTFTFLVEIIQLVVYTREGFNKLSSGWGDLDSLDIVGGQWFSVVFMTSFIASVNQFFYAWRIWVLSGNLRLPTVVILLSLLQLVSGVYASAMAAHDKRYSILKTAAFPERTISFASTAVCDIVIAACMLYYLSHGQRISNFRNTTILVTRIVRVTIETGLICAALALIDLGLYVGLFGHNIFVSDATFSILYNNTHVPICATLSKVYSISLLAVLNTRIRIIGGRNEQYMPDATMSLLSSSHPESPTPYSPQFALSPRATQTFASSMLASERKFSGAPLKPAVLRGSTDRIQVIQDDSDL